MRLRRYTAATLVAAVMVSVSGCAGDEGTPGESKGGAPAAVGASLTADNFGERVAAAQMGSRSAHIEATTSLPMGQRLAMSGDLQVGLRAAELELAMVARMGDQGSIELRLVDGVAYVRLPTSLASTGKPWVSVDLRDPENPIGALFRQLMSSLEPAKFQELYSAVEELENLGSEKVRGLTATHYRVSVDTAKAFAVLDLGKVSGVDLEQTLKDLPKTAVTDVWVDENALLVKVASELGGVKSEMYFSKWGEPVSVQAPPARSVGELPF